MPVLLIDLYCVLSLLPGPYNIHNKCLLHLSGKNSLHEVLEEL